MKRLTVIETSGHALAAAEALREEGIEAEAVALETAVLWLRGPLITVMVVRGADVRPPRP